MQKSAWHFWEYTFFLELIYALDVDLISVASVAVYLFPPIFGLHTKLS